MKDEAFASGMMGDGFAIEFNGENVYSPVDGIVKMCFPTKHAIGIKSSSGSDVIIHIGIDTVNMNGIGFNLRVTPEQKVNKGDLLIDVNSSFIKEKGYDPTTMILFPNGETIKILKKDLYVNEKEEVAECLKN